jgi:predicted dinucleotide-binding enzyme
MKICIIGLGVVGQQLGLGFVKLGHQVRIGTRDISKLANWKSTAGENASAGSFTDVAKFGHIIIIGSLWRGTKNAIPLAGLENFKEKIQNLLPDSNVVNTINTHIMCDPKRKEG